MRFSILVPDATVNYIKNPSVRYDTTEWNAAGATLTRTLDYARFGISSLKVVTAGTALREGTYYRVTSLTSVAGSGSPITVSAYVRGTGIVRIRVIDSPAGQEWASQRVQLRADRWTRISATGMIKGSNDVRLYVETDEGSAKARTFYVDGAQMELKPYATLYCDGDQDGCFWNGLYHASTSQRPANTRAGGRWVQLAGEERAAEDLYMTVAGGLGMAPIKNHIQSYALAPGAFFQNNKIETRTITLTFHAKHKNMFNRSQALSLSALHQLRQLLIDVIKPDLTGGNEPIWFEYDNGETPVRFQARYDGGLDGEWDIRNQWTNSFPLRLLAVDPFVYEDSQEAAALDFQESVTVNYVAGRINGKWDRLNYGMSDGVNGFALGPRGQVYAVGKFQKINNNALAVDPMVTANGVAYWDGTEWIRLGSGMNVLDNYNAIAVAPNGYVYVTGNFTSIGGVAANRIAYWDGSAWNAMGTGLNGNGYCLAIGPDGSVYVGGSFTQAGGVTRNRIAKWDGTKWNNVGQYAGLDQEVRALAITKDGLTLYVGGFFQSEASVNTLRMIASYNTVTGLFSAMGSGFSGQATARVYALVLSSSGSVYAAGDFTLSGTTTVNGIAKWNGGAWEPLGSGIKFASATLGVGTLASLAMDKNDFLYMGGTFSLSLGTYGDVGGIRCEGFAIWNGSSWLNPDILLNTNFPVTALLLDKSDNLYIGIRPGFSSGNLLDSGITTISNLGTTEVRPVIYISGQGTLRLIENQTTGKRIYFDMVVQVNEEVTIDFGRGTIKSNVRGDIFYTMLSGSDFRSFVLAPGENKIACFMHNDVGAQMTIQYQPTHWSTDAVQNVENL